MEMRREPQISQTDQMALKRALIQTTSSVNPWVGMGTERAQIVMPAGGVLAIIPDGGCTSGVGGQKEADREGGNAKGKKKSKSARRRERKRKREAKAEEMGVTVVYETLDEAQRQTWRVRGGEAAILIPKETMLWTIDTVSKANVWEAVRAALDKARGPQDRDRGEGAEDAGSGANGKRKRAEEDQHASKDEERPVNRRRTGMTGAEMGGSAQASGSGTRLDDMAGFCVKEEEDIDAGQICWEDYEDAYEENGE